SISSSAACRTAAQARVPATTARRTAPERTPSAPTTTKARMIAAGTAKVASQRGQLMSSRRRFIMIVPEVSEAMRLPGEYVGKTYKLPIGNDTPMGQAHDIAPKAGVGAFFASCNRESQGRGNLRAIRSFALVGRHAIG